MGNLIQLEEHFQQFVSVKHARASYGGCEVTLNLPWHVAENLAAMAAPFLQAVTDTLETRTREQAERDVQRRRSEIEYANRQREWKVRLLCNLKKVYADGMHYYDFCRALEPRPYTGTAQSAIHKLYYDARARKSQKMRNEGRSNREIAEHFGMEAKALGAVFRRKLT
ncbi:MAG: hypothetical protein P8P30_00220 [Rickettsiales bacterium]|nr:hypothetical protein [Rickettsiales bacterium]